MIHLNGKFLAQRTTGVQRFARGVVTALDRSLQSTPCGQDVELLLPPAATPIEGLQVIRQRVIGMPGRSLTAWEQLELPRRARGGTLLCLSGSAPFFAGDCLPTIHDAAVYRYPQAYSRPFVTWYRLLFARRARRSPLVLTVSESSARDLAPHLPRTTFRVVPNSAEHITAQLADTSVLERLQLSPRGFLLAVGSLNPTKNFGRLIKAYATSALADRLPLVIVGAVNRDVFRADGPVADHPNVRWAGPVPDGQLRALYEAAAAFVFPSLYEGFGIPPLEAMRCGCPVVASRASSIPEVCGDAADYFDPLDPSAMIAAIVALLDDPARRQALVSRGLTRADAFSWDHAAERLRDALAEFRFIER
ncbi:glycosyltransferase family 4 protein [Roseateles sp. BYS96W]|uniref:Glycosyltransferase family 4 protein n=1 Tax=Pelomonas nitida TaxID=3299027 RepID=A0ABW7G4R2_9BURK